MDAAHNNKQAFSPLVTVVTVVFNDVRHLEQTMLSVLDQTYAKNIEYIVIDGGSTDGTVDVIKKYAHRLAYWVSEKDKGIADAMNKGVARATGEWLNCINSGDYFMSLTVFEEIFSKPHTADHLYGSFIGNFNGRSVVCVAAASATEKAWQGMQLCHSTLFSRLRFLQQHPFSKECKVSADTEYVAWCVANHCTFERLDQVIFRVGTLGNSAEHWLRGRLENWKIARTYFPAIRTDIFHAKGIVKESLFRIVKTTTSWIGLYQLVRYVYRKKLRDRITLLPPNCLPFKE